MLLFEKNNIELEYHPALNSLEVRWIGALEEEEWTVMWRKVVAGVKKYRIENILIDATHAEATTNSALYEPPYFPQKSAIPIVKKIAWVSARPAPQDQDANHYVSFYTTVHY